METNSFGPSDSFPSMGSGFNDPTSGFADSLPPMGSGFNDPTSGFADSLPPMGSGFNDPTSGFADSLPPMGSGFNDPTSGFADSLPPMGSGFNDPTSGFADSLPPMGSGFNDPTSGFADSLPPMGSGFNDPSSGFADSLPSMGSGFSNPSYGYWGSGSGSGSEMITNNGYPYSNYYYNYEFYDHCADIDYPEMERPPKITGRMTIGEVADFHTEILVASDEICSRSEMGYCDSDQSWCHIYNADEVVGEAAVEKVWKIIQDVKCPKDTELCDLIDEDFDSDECWWSLDSDMWPNYGYWGFDNSTTVKQLANKIWSLLKDERTFCEYSDCDHYEINCLMDNAFWSVLSEAEGAMIQSADKNCIGSVTVCDVLTGWDDYYDEAYWNY